MTRFLQLPLNIFEKNSIQQILFQNSRITQSDSYFGG